MAGRIEHTLLNPSATQSDISRLCKEASVYSFRSVCINPVYVSYVRNILSDTGIKLCTVIGFPLGSNTVSGKVFEAMEAVKEGADELDVVINIGAVKASRWDAIKREISDIITATPRVIHKVIIETCYLSDDEKRKICEVIMETGAEFIKTSTGYGFYGAKSKDVKLIKGIVGNRMKIKASGGIQTLKKAVSFLNVGADTIGTSSGVKIMEDFIKAKKSGI